MVHGDYKRALANAATCRVITKGRELAFSHGGALAMRDEQVITAEQAGELIRAGATDTRVA
jgi:hypothetical protein